MPAPFLLFAALAGAHMSGGDHRGHFDHGRPAPQSVGAVVDRHVFISPMGEPFHGAGDGLTAWFNGADRNHDGSITLDEFKQDAERFFLTLDLNKDGQIDPDEIDRYETVVAPEIRSGGAAFDDSDINDEATGGAALGLLTIPEPVMAADSNLDRGVSAQEFENAAEKRFALLDRDGDGRLTLSELQGAREAIRGNARRARNPAPTDSDDSDPGIAEQPMPQD